MRLAYATPGLTADVPLCTYGTAPEAATARVSFLLPHLDRMVPMTPSAAHLAGVRDHLQEESMSIAAALIFPVDAPRLRSEPLYDVSASTALL